MKESTLEAKCRALTSVGARGPQGMTQRRLI